MAGVFVLILYKFIGMIYSDEFFMKEALKEATKGFVSDEIPVGAVIVHNNTIISRAHNLCEKLCDPMAHAEMQVLKSACQHLKTKYLTECIVYTTLEPCAMCAGALFWTKVHKVVYGATDKKRGISTISNKILHPKTIIISNIMKDESSNLLTTFFQKKRISTENIK